MKQLSAILKVLLATLALGAMAACEQEGPMERAGENLDDAMEDMGDSMDNARNNLEDACEDLKEGVGAADSNC